MWTYPDGSLKLIINTLQVKRVSREELGGKMGGFWGQVWSYAEYPVPTLQGCQLVPSAGGLEGELEGTGAHSPAFQVAEGRQPPPAQVKEEEEE